MRTRMVLGVVVLISLLAISSSAQQLIKQIDIGNASEGSTYISTGPFANHIALIDRFSVVGVPMNSAGTSTMHKLFDLTSLVTKANLNGMPRGITYIPGEKLFVFDTPESLDQLFLVDNKGALAETIPITYSGDWSPSHVEELDYIPTNAPRYAGHILRVAVLMDTLEARIEVIRRDGVVVKEIVPNFLLNDYENQFLLGLTYMPDGTLMVTQTGDDAIWHMDMDGNYLGGPWYVAGNPPGGGFEGITRLPNGNFAVNEGLEGVVRVVDAGFKQVAKQDRSFKTGLDLFSSNGIGWNPGDNNFVVSNFATAAPWGIYSVPLGGGSKTLIGSVEEYACCWGDIDYVPGDQLIAVAHKAGNNHSDPTMGIMYFDMAGNGHDAGTPFRGAGITYLPGLDLFLARDIDVGPATQFWYMDRYGNKIFPLSFASTGLASVSAVAYFTEASGEGRFLVFGKPDRAIVTDAFGTELREFNYHELLQITVPADATYISSGRYAGKFAVLPQEMGTIAIIDINPKH